MPDVTRKCDSQKAIQFGAGYATIRTDVKEKKKGGGMGATLPAKDKPTQVAIHLASPI